MREQTCAVRRYEKSELLKVSSESKHLTEQ